MLLRTDILQKTVVRCPCLSSMTFFLGTTCLPSQEARRFFTFKRIRKSTYYIKQQQQQQQHHIFFMDVPELFSIPPPQPTTRRCSRAICLLNSSFVLMKLIASIITFSKKKFWKKICYSRPSPSTWNPRDRLAHFYSAISAGY